jgi:hypothetical protein
MRVVTGEPAHDAEEFVIAALQRPVFRQKSEVPFPDERGAVAGRAQQRRQCRKAGRDPHLRLIAIDGAQRLDQAQLEAVLVAPGDQRDPRVGAERRIGVGLRETHPFSGEPVERRRPVTGLPGAAEIRVPAVVNDDKDDIRAIRAGHIVSSRTAPSLDATPILSKPARPPVWPPSHVSAVALHLSAVAA